ncbi:MAG: hypothetical protein ACLU9S_03620 [Oscillospiraceae bacterium]
MIGAAPLRGLADGGAGVPGLQPAVPGCGAGDPGGLHPDIKDWVQRGQVDCAPSSYSGGEEGFEIIATMKEEIVAAVPGFSSTPAAMARERATDAALVAGMIAVSPDLRLF